MALQKTPTTGNKGPASCEYRIYFQENYAINVVQAVQAPLDLNQLPDVAWLLDYLENACHKCSVAMLTDPRQPVVGPKARPATEVSKFSSGASWARFPRCRNLGPLKPVA
jgi:hypothetical protein